ncbi:Gfo/Idh/MocA family protein [Hyphococcus luteus]|uniref:Gfo/Idh/MocA family protein n=1 Tax=Hyphococcus luteus TaxID=2058213 RepID=UPI0013FD6872|nr:Gfo/Idh/MocA family oxidoreductase [Marinicaulis flavus]
MTKPIRVGVAGAGVFGGHHSAKIAAHDQASLAGVFDVDPARAEAMADRFKVSCFTDYAALIEAVDAIIVAAPASVHYDLAYEALAAGRHVFIEKPIALETADADALILLARGNGAVLQIGHQERYVAEAAGLLSIGKSPVKIDCVRRTGASGRCEDVSVVLDLMVHDLDLVRKLTNADIESVTANGDAHDAKAELTLTNGALVNLEASRRADAPERRMTLVYDDGIIEFDFVNRTAANTTGAALHADFDADEAPPAFRDPLGFGASAFIDAVMHLREPIVTGEDGRDALDWARRIENAAGIGLAEEFETTERLRA